MPDVAIRASLCFMGDLRLVELSASTIVAVNNMSLKPGQEQFLAPVSYGVAATVVNPQTTWQRVVLDGEEVVGFVSANFDPEETQEHFRSVLWRINVDADDQGRGVGRFAVAGLLEEARNRGMDHVDVIYEAGEDGPEAFFRRVGFTPVGETEYGEVIAEIRL
jgi:diamine N-acetyltransferase